MEASIWLIGDVAACEFSPAVAWLCEKAVCTLFADPRDAISRSTRRGAGGHGPNAHEPASIVYCAIRPGSVLQAQVDALSRSFPLARLLALVGTWCAGEVRSGRPWPGVPRIYWYQWQTRLTEFMDELYGASPRRLPRTMTDVDLLLSWQTRPRPANVASRIGIVTNRRVDFESLRDALGLTLGDCPWLMPEPTTPPAPVDLLLVDENGDLTAACEALRQTRSAMGPLPALVLCHFPRPNELRDLLAVPRTAVLTKPYLFRDVRLALAALLAAPAEQVSPSASAAA